MNSSPPVRILSGVAAAIALASLAHAGLTEVIRENFIPGLVGPLRGWDHVLLFGGTGFWAAQLGRRAHWTVPVMLITVVACGAALGARGAEPAMLSTATMTALLTFGLLVLGQVRWTFAAVAAPLGVIAVFDGVGHGPQFAAAGATAGLAAGLLVANALLYAAGYGGGLVVHGWIRRRHANWGPHAGGRVAP